MLNERCGATLSKVYAVVINMYYMEMGETYCDCCGPELELEFQGYVVHSLHMSKENAEKKSKEIVFEEELRGIEYDSAKVYVEEMEVSQ